MLVRWAGTSHFVFVNGLNLEFNKLCVDNNNNIQWGRIVMELGENCRICKKRSTKRYLCSIGRTMLIEGLSERKSRERGLTHIV